MPNIMVNGKLATVDGVQVPVTTGSVKDVLAYIEKQKAPKPVEKIEEVAEAPAAEETPKAEEAPKAPAPKAK